jgi:hypothetical protein
VRAVTTSSRGYGLALMLMLLIGPVLHRLPAAAAVAQDCSEGCPLPLDQPVSGSFPSGGSDLRIVDVPGPGTVELVVGLSGGERVYVYGPNGLVEDPYTAPADEEHVITVDHSAAATYYVYLDNPTAGGGRAYTISASWAPSSSAIAPPLEPASPPVRASPVASSLNFSTLPTGDQSDALPDFGFTIVANPPNLGIPSDVAGGTGKLDVFARGANQVLSSGATQTGHFIGPVHTYSQFSTLTCVTLLYTGAGSLTSFGVTRIGVSGGGSTPAWQVSAYDSSSTLLGTTGEGDITNGGFYFPSTPQTFAISTTRSISLLVICTRNQFSTYGAIPLVELMKSVS